MSRSPLLVSPLSSSRSPAPVVEAGYTASDRLSPVSGHTLLVLHREQGKYDSSVFDDRFSIVKVFVGVLNKEKVLEGSFTGHCEISRSTVDSPIVSQLPGDHGSGAHIPVVVGDCILGAPGEDVPCQYQPGQDSQRRHLCGSWRGGTERRVNKGRADYWELIPFPLTIS